MDRFQKSSLIVSEEDGSDVALIQIFGHVFCNYSFVEVEQVEVAFTHFRSDLEANVEKLTEAWIVRRCILDVAQSGGKLAGGP